ncbi:response regulator [Vibrio anguillarum]|jgi:signal transduction histidine kinase/CheY-like chemotaxis protein|uniref:histidine kinase n=5 Tax=Vibrio anguillarum TaxID=55601 RepID=A0ABR9Z497_VIBAN|nr:ATP-binding protein [Vibrio anguillarum]MBF4244345.1 response regulator [Vibrio anguillarum]MBF4372817.1 response regulator [Vibrio anguillarum]
MTKASSVWEQRLLREKAARIAAEQLLEQKSREIYEINQYLQQALEAQKLKSMVDIFKLELKEHIDAILIRFGRRFLFTELNEALINTFIDSIPDRKNILQCELILQADLFPTYSQFHFSNCWLPKKEKMTSQKEILLPIYSNTQQVGELIFTYQTHPIEFEFIVKQVNMLFDLLSGALSKHLDIQSKELSRKQAEDSEKATKEFVTMVNHEIRTPLVGILGSADLLETTYLTDEQKKYLADIQHSGEMLNFVINDLLDFNKLHSGLLRINDQPFEWLQLHNYVYNLVSIKKKNTTLNFIYKDTLPEYVYGDKKRIQQILLNLIGNSLKFTLKGEINIYISWADDKLKIDVKDTGIGIPEYAQKKIFDAFYQVDRSSTRQFEGLGMGLAICLSLTKLMNGLLSVKSSEGEGSEFSVVLPLPAANKPNTKTMTNTLVSEWNGRKLAILVADDIEMNRIIIQGMLGKLGISPDFSHNGVEALDAVQHTQYDLIFMDCRMPEMDGFEASQHLREQGYNKPIIALTAGTTMHKKQHCIACGMDDVLSKPYRLEDLKTILQKWLSAADDSQPEMQ